MSKSKEVKFRLTENELEAAKEIAEKYGMTINALAKFLVLNLEEPVTKTDRKYFKKLNGDIGQIGNNINQIARKINTSSYFVSREKEQIIKSLFEIRNETRRLIGKEEISEEDFFKEGKINPQNKRVFY